MTVGRGRGRGRGVESLTEPWNDRVDAETFHLLSPVGSVRSFFTFHMRILHDR